MAHEELKKQYEEDCKNYDRPWELWEMASIKKDDWVPLDTHPLWFPNLRYRRKEPPFKPEYYSGLNWRDAEHLIGKVVEFSDDGYDWNICRGLGHIYTKDRYRKRFEDFTGVRWEYIRTTPETHAHPTITLTVNGREYVLPKPETEAPEMESIFYKVHAGGSIVSYTWDGGMHDKDLLKGGHVHLTEPRAQAWADFWQEAILGAVRGPGRTENLK